ncbi:putative COP9 subunit 3 [Aspergillus homomorphus CBS 101889]|uniref:Signalosome subunit 3 n=1 Tax=Aspergillus homomorphus (strain CBS 101889) TaxID=1450537 RepID=A0A395IC04_ASPHC|nr:signalosome subunit 3 [Aspergillus homomorphus CBS 101889]RAL15694.1 signalosome subunit 3 [Aspergillus homomorphus CBS 101889]
MAESIQHIISLSSRLHSHDFLSKSDYDWQIQELISILKRSNYSLLSGGLLTDLDPFEHTLPFLFALLCQIDSVQSRTRSALPEDVKPGGKLWSKTIQFLRTLNSSQICYVWREWCQLVEVILRAAENVGKPLLAVRVTSDAILRVDPTASLFTSFHPTFLRLCLLSQAHSYALPILDKHISRYRTGFELPPKNAGGYILSSDNYTDNHATEATDMSTRLTHRDLSKYYLYGGMIYMALKEWDKALHSLSIVISLPVVNSVSKIMVDGFKKWVLVSLLRHGKLATTPKMISTHVARAYQALAKPYVSLADAFEKGDHHRLRTEADLGKPIWRADCNQGLVHQIFRAYDMFLVLKLGSTFSALTTGHIAKRASSSLGSTTSIESLVACLVMSEVLEAKLLQLQRDEFPTMLRFPTSVRVHSKRRDITRLELLRKGYTLELLARGIGERNNEFRMGHDNIDFLMKCQGWPGISGKGTQGGFDSTIAGVEEDIMGDIN